MDPLTDPRRFATGCNELPPELTAAVHAGDESARHARLRELSRSIAGLLETGREIDIRSALASMPDAAHYRLYWRALTRAVESPVAADSGPQAVVAGVFAIPLVLVAAATQARTIPGSLPDIAAVQAILERTAALGPVRSFGLSNRLCTLEALEALDFVSIYRAGRSIAADPLEAKLPAEAIALVPSREQAHLRFLIAAAICPAHAPGLAETSARIGAWGMEVSRLLGAQLAVPDVQLLVLPRAPQGLLVAQHAGRFAQLEVAFNLFVSNTLRRFRMRAGDPVAVLSTHDDGELRVTLSCAFAEDLTEGFRWPLSKLDDLPALEERVLQMLHDVRLHDVRVVPDVLPSNRDRGGYWFPGVDEADLLLANHARH
jgi:hypothetical protein